MPCQSTGRPGPHASLLGQLRRAASPRYCRSQRSPERCSRPSRQALLIEGANPRHAHEWAVWQDAKLPDDKILVPGVIDSATQLRRASRARRAAHLPATPDVVGHERVIAGTDCGFGTFAGFGAVHPDIAYAKLHSLADGAAIASQRLWSKVEG